MCRFPMIAFAQSERNEACPNAASLLQPVLSTDKCNPVFSVYRNAGTVSLLLVYHGAELIAVVPEDRQHPAFKLLIG